LTVRVCRGSESDTISRAIRHRFGELCISNVTLRSARATASPSWLLSLCRSSACAELRHPRRQPGPRYLEHYRELRAVLLIHCLASEWFGTCIFVLSPGRFHGTIALTYSVEAFFSALLGFLCWRVSYGAEGASIIASLALGVSVSGHHYAAYLANRGCFLLTNCRWFPLAIKNSSSARQPCCPPFPEASTMPQQGVYPSLHSRLPYVNSREHPLNPTNAKQAP